MLDSIFIYSAVIGGAFLLFQFAMMMLGFAHDGGDLDVAGGHDFDMGGGHELDMGGGHDFDVGGGHDLDVGGADGHVGGIDDAVGHHQSAGAHHHPAGLFYEMISLRTLSAAATFFGLVGMTATANGFSTPLAFICASVSGCAALYGTYWIFKQVYRLETAGNENIQNAIGKHARVYVPIPGNDQGAGKVQFKMQERLVEYQAVTEDNEKLPTGENVVVVGIVNSDTVRVARAEQLAEA